MSEGQPSFHLRAVGFFKTALTRQIAEAIRIEKWGEDVVLNSKGEYNGNRLPRVTFNEGKPDEIKMVKGDRKAKFQ